MGLGDLANKAKEALSANEDAQDKILDTASSAAKKVTGNKFDGAINKARSFADEKLGDPTQPGNAKTSDTKASEAK